MISLSHTLILPRVGLGLCRHCSDIRRTVPKPRDEKQRRLREEFWAREQEFERGVDYSRLNQEQRVIHEAHKEAVRNLHFTYDDPKTGLKVITRLRHFLKGSCCGNACRNYLFILRTEFRQRIN